jgi:uncharacterized SAM-binding protein YcdF (DUF218 family)
MDSVFFWISKLAWKLVSPDVLVLFFILLAWILLWRGAFRVATWLLGSVSAALLILALLPLGEWLLHPLEARFQTNPELPPEVDGVILLGGSSDPVGSALWKQVQLGASAEREFAFLELAERYPQAKLVFTGGSGRLLANREFRGADVAKSLFGAQGLDLSRVLFERESRNTYENGVLSKQLANPGSGETWVLITTASHMPRSVGVFCKVGWPVLPYPVDHNTRPGNPLNINLDFAGHLSGLKTAAHEWVGLIAYYLTGKTTALVPDACTWQTLRPAG